MENAGKLKIIIAILSVLIIAGLALLVYNRYKNNILVINLPLSFLNEYLPHSISENEEKNIKSLAENFVSKYGTYVSGSFWGLESLKDQMTHKLWEEKSAWIDIQKQALAGQPKHYISFSAIVRKSDIISYDYNVGEAEIEVEYLRIEIKGAYIQEKQIIKYVNEFGEEKLVPPPSETVKKIKLELVKKNNTWKVNNIITIQ